MITIIFQQSLDTGMPAPDWLKANVIALFKNKGSRTSPENYRPISLTCVICKLFEHVLFTSIMAHYNKYDILFKNQHGFQKGRSCETQLVNTVDEIGEALDKKKTLHCVILDFSKAFDTVCHERLIRKLLFYGVNDKVVMWIKNWLTNRTQTVIVDGFNSSEVKFKSGVPQGTVLGTLLFLT